MRSTHYRPVTQNPHLLEQFGDWAASTIQRRTEAPPVLVYQGMSGIVLATTTALAFYKLTGVLPYMVYVRKEEEDSHGDPVEYNYQSGEGTMAYLQKDRQFFFIDDFIESGTTLHYCRQAVQRTFGVELTGKNLTLLTSSANTDFDAWDDCIDLGECDEYVWNTGASSTKQPLKLTESTISTE